MHRGVLERNEFASCWPISNGGNFRQSLIGQNCRQSCHPTNNRFLKVILELFLKIKKFVTKPTNTNLFVNSMFFSFCIKKGKHAGDVRKDVASICDRVFDLISILGKVDFGSNSYIGTKIIFFKNRFLKIDLGQTAPPKMTAMTIGWFQVFGETIDLTRFLSM